MKRKTRVLMVDDDPDYADSIRLILEAGGYEFHHAGDGKAGLAKAQKLLPDVIILDVVMNKQVAGFLFAKTLREAGGPLSKVPILILTGMRRQEGFVVPSSAGDPVFTPSDEFLEKPVKPVVLLKAIEELTTARKSG